jgi:opacity protein-like surface antigen
MRFCGLRLAIALLAWSVAAEAQPFQGLYVGAGTGYNLPQNVPLATGGALQPNGEFIGLGSVGYALGNGVRFEVEGDYRHAGLNRSTSAFNTSGSLQTYGVMVNGLFDLDVGAPWIFPYLGGGVGYAWSNLSSQVTFTPASFPLLGSRTDQTQGNFAFQAIGGLSFPIPDVPGLSVTIECRFFAIPGRENFASTQLLAGPPSPAPVTLRAQHQSNHGFLLGVRYAFNVAAPIPVPPTPPAPS